MHNIVLKPLRRKFDGALSLDVIEHISHELEDRFVANIAQSLRPHGICIVGTPNVEAQRHASPTSAVGHINLKSAENLRELLSKSFHNVLIFSMNDEIVHTGFYPMAHYLFGVAIDPKRRGQGVQA